MANSAACDRCAKAVKKDEDFIECMGFCDQICHIRCAGLNGPFVKILRDKNNLFWMCDECVKLMKFSRFKNVVSSLGSVISSVIGDQLNCMSELKAELAKNNHQVAQLADKVDAATPLQVRNRERPAKRRRGDTDTPIRVVAGTRAVANDDLIVAGPQPSLFWVYLSRFHPTVKADTVERLVRDGLQTRDTVRVVSLVKKGTDPCSLNFISFKVGVSVECRTAALNPGTWPQGIVFREFEDTRTERSVWLPPTVPSVTVTASDTPVDSVFGTPLAPSTPAPLDV